MRTAIALLASAAVGALAAIVWSGPRSESWPFAATVDDLIGWSSTQSTATTVGQLLVVVTVALALGLRLPTRIVPWVLAAVLVVVLAFTKIAVPEAASLSVFTALHILKSSAAGLLVGLVLHATSRSRAGWVALATGLLGGTVLASVGTTAASASFVPTRLDSTSVFGEPAWWLIGTAFTMCILAAIVHRPESNEDDPTRGELARLTVYAVIVAVVCRLGVEFVGTGDHALWKAVVVLVVSLIVVDRVAARWEAADARTIIVVVLITASAIGLWNAGARTSIDSRVLTAAGIGGLVLGSIVAWRFAVGRITSWLSAVALVAVPMVTAALHVDVVAAVALGVVAALIPIALTAVTPNPHVSVRPLAAALPGLGILFTAAAPVPAVDLAASIPADLSDLMGQGGVLMLRGQGAGSPANATLDLTSAYLMLGVGILCTLRLVWLSRRSSSAEPVPD